MAKESEFTMIRTIVIILILCQIILCYPQSIRIPDIRNKVPPEEINELLEHRQYPRSIDSKPSKSHNNVEDTIKEVEAMIKANPTLPRLTRGEILDLLDNITKMDMAANQVSSENLKDRDPKAIMVVMPYTPTNTNENHMEELFTKPPVTHIIGAEPFKKASEIPNSKPEPTDITNVFELGKVKKSEAEKDKSFRGNVQYQKKSITSTTTTAPENVPAIKESFSEQPTYTENNVKKNPNKRRRRPQKSTTEQQISSTERSTTISLTTYQSKGRRPVRRRPTTTEKHPNHKYPDETTTEVAKTTPLLPSSGIRIVDAPKFSPSEVNDDIHTEKNQEPEIFVKNPISEELYSVPQKHIPTPIIAAIPNTTDFSLIDLVPDHLKGILESMNPAQLTNNDKLPSAKDEEKIKNILPSFGSRPSKKTTTTTTTTSIPDISSVADNLSPEMRDLLISFGLIPDPHDTVAAASEIIDSYNPVKAEVKAESYVGFKPLPEDQSSRHDMEELLARFGLGKSARHEKSLPKKTEQQLSFDAVPDQFKGVLENIGLTDRQAKMIKTEPLVKTLEKKHVFSPIDQQYASNEEIEKLNKLIDVVKQLEKLNGTVTDEDLKKIDVDNLKELVSSLNEENKIVPLDEQHAPNPVNYGYGLNKNDVKRQQNSSSTTPPASTRIEVATPNIKDLEDSFGGQTDATPVTSTAAPETTMPTRRTGFYYLVDWNTFLDIDDQKGKRVNLRFQPTIGDPKKFYSVTVP